MTASTPHAPARASRLAGYLLALAAGATWGTTGPLSTGLYALMPATSIGFWRVLLGTVCLAAWGLLFYRELFRGEADRAQEHAPEADAGHGLPRRVGTPVLPGAVPRGSRRLAAGGSGRNSSR